MARGNKKQKEYVRGYDGDQELPSMRKGQPALYQTSDPNSEQDRG